MSVLTVSATLNRLLKSSAALLVTGAILLECCSVVIKYAGGGGRLSIDAWGVVSPLSKDPCELTLELELVVELEVT